MAKGMDRKGQKRVLRKTCTLCSRELNINEFYISYNTLHTDGHIPFCKECLVRLCYNTVTDEIDVEKFKSLLQQLDKPFIYKLWNSVTLENEKAGEKTKKNIIKRYMRTINSMVAFRNMTWQQGNEYNISASMAGQIGATQKRNEYANEVYYLENDGFEVTQDIVKLFGEGYTAKEYEMMWDDYNKHIGDYPNASITQKELLLNYIRYSTREKIAAARGNINDIEKYANLSSKAFQKLNQINVQGNVNCFSEFFQKFEREQDIARILPKFKYRPNDAPDFIIWCYVNYCRRLEGKTECQYEDVYKFYDERVEEYVKQYGDPYGIFTDDTTQNNREKIKDFITLPEDFDE